MYKVISTLDNVLLSIFTERNTHYTYMPQCFLPNMLSKNILIVLKSLQIYTDSTYMKVVTNAKVIKV